MFTNQHSRVVHKCRNSVVDRIDAHVLGHDATRTASVKVQSLQVERILFRRAGKQKGVRILDIFFS